MPVLHRRSRRALLTSVVVAVLVAAFAPVFTGTAAATTPALEVVPEAVAAVDVLPTVQIDGVAWSQAIVGNTVFAGGEFTTARPAGAAPGIDTVARKNLLSYDITTGVLHSRFNPWVNAPVLAVAAAPDGSRVYIGGHFLKADGSVRTKLAAYDVATGKLVADFAPVLNDAVRSLYVTEDRVYVGGSFTTANGQSRQRLAAFDLSGTLLDWAPTANRQVDAMVMNPDGTKLIIGGRFDRLNGIPKYGLRALDPVTAREMPWAAASVIRSGSQSYSGVTGLATDGVNVYGTSYAHGPDNPLEGGFALTGSTGDVLWIDDCHGDTYSIAPLGDQVYLAGHTHTCDTSEGLPKDNPAPYWRGLGFTKEATKVAKKNMVKPEAYANWGGTPAPSMVSWFPSFDQGTATGMNQGPWNVVSNGEYLLYAGEFPRVNSIPQQGLVRFAAKDIAPNKIGPEAQPNLTPALRTTDSGTVQVSWQQAWDRDDRALTYLVYRNGNNDTPVHTVTANSRFWDQPWLTFTDPGRPLGTTVGYRVVARDAAGNETSGATATIAIDEGSAPTDAYRDRVAADGASLLWRLREADGTPAWDAVGGTPGTVGDGVVRGAEAGLAAAFDGTNASTVVADHRTWGPAVFTVQAWFSTTATVGGQLIGFGSAVSGVSDVSDRALYLSDTGQVGFALSEEGTLRSVLSAGSWNDGARHLATGTYDGTTFRLYVDGREQASATAAVPGHQYGNWRVGGDRLTGAEGAPTSYWVTGSLSDVAVYPTALSARTVDDQYWTGRIGTPNTAPVADFTASVRARTITVDGSTSADATGEIVSYAWEFGDGTTATGPTAEHDYAADGSYEVALTVTDSGGLSHRTVQSVDAVNLAPAAVFDVVAGGLTVRLDASAATDDDGEIVSHTWDLGDGTSADGVVVDHTYAGPGTWTVTLTVTDDLGSTHQQVQQVSVTRAPPVPFASDTFDREIVGGLGDATVGGTWTTQGAAAGFGVSGGVGRLQLSAPAETDRAFLAGVSTRDVDLQLDLAVDRIANGNGVYLSTVARKLDGNDYRAKVRVLANGQATVTLSRTVGNAETALAAATVPGVRVEPGVPLRVRLLVRDSATPGSTDLAAKVWPAVGTEPVAWQVVATDATAVLQTPGGVGASGYLSSGSTSAPVTMTIDNFTARAPLD